MTIVLNELQDLTVPVAEDFNFNFRALKDAVEAVEALAVTMIPMVPGAVVPYAGATAPDGWLLCDGSAVSRATYSALFAVIGETYGAGDGSTTFAVPNLKGRVAVGFDAAQTEFDALGETGGAKTVTLTTAELPAHAHGVSDPTHAHGVSDPTHTHSLVPRSGTLTAGSGNEMMAATGPVADAFTNASLTGIAVAAAGTGIAIQNAGGGGAHNNLPPYQTLHHIIKT